MDLNMPNLSGFEATKLILQKNQQLDLNQSMSSALDELMGYDANKLNCEMPLPYIVALSASVIDDNLRKKCS
jgi:CheY-like chemotaxis protein